MSRQKPTSDEHFIPQFYLKQFSPDREHIFQFDVLSGKQTPVAVSTKSICYQKHLYEFRNDDGEFLYRNALEHLLGRYEIEFAKVFKSIQSKASSCIGFQSLNFLSDNEIAMLSVFLTTLIARKPEVLQAGVDVAKEILGVTQKPVFWTSDNPITLYGKYPPLKPDEVVFPLSPCLVLYMMPYEKTKPECYNRLVELSERDVEFINHSTAAHCQRWIYSQSPLSEEQKKWIANQRER